MEIMGNGGLWEIHVINRIVRGAEDCGKEWELLETVT